MISCDSLEELYPPVKRAAKELLRRMKAKGVKIGVSSTYRDAEAQDALYAMGRTMPGMIVTNSKGGDSAHNYRLAFDIIHNGNCGGEYCSAVMRQVGEEAERMGLTWGANSEEWLDMAHIQWTDGISIHELKQGAMPEDKLLKWESA